MFRIFPFGKQPTQSPTTPTFLPPVVTDGARPTITIRGLALSRSHVDIFLNNLRITILTPRDTNTGVGDFWTTIDTHALIRGTYTVRGVGYDANDIPSKTKTVTVFRIGANGSSPTKDHHWIQSRCGRR